MGMSGTEGGSLPGYRFPLWARAMSGVALYATAIFWISQLGYSQYYPDSPAVAAAGTQWRLAFTVGTMAAGAVLSLAAHRVLSHLLSCHLIFCVGALFGVSMAFVLATNPAAPSFVGGAAFLASAMGCAWANILVISLVCGCESNTESLLVAFGGSVLAQLALAFNQMLTPHDLQFVPIVVAFVLFALLGVMVVPLIGHPSYERAERAEMSAGGVLRSFLRHPGPPALIAGSALGIVSARGVGNYGVWGRYLGQAAPAVDTAALGVSVALAVAMGAIAVLLLRRMRLPGAFFAPFSIFAIGFAAIVAARLLGVDGAVGGGLSQAVYSLVCALSIFYAARCAECLSTNPVRTGGALLALLGCFSLLWMIFLEYRPLLALGVSLVLSYGFVLVATTAGKGTRRSSAFEPKQEDSLLVLERASAILAAEHGLTPRECELLKYLLQGRSVPWISERLVISEGTIRTHVQNIYKKIGVHSKQELISLALGDS